MYNQPTRCRYKGKKNNETLLIEAKGETSSFPNSANFNKPFKSSAIRSHVAKAILTSLIERDRNNSDTTFGIALPNNAGHRKLIMQVSKSLNFLNLKVYWVSTNGVAEE